MRIPCFAPILSVITGSVLGYEIEEQRFYPTAPQRAVLKIVSTADLDVFDPITIAFQAEYPIIVVDYSVAGTSDLMQAIYQEGAVFDLAISSAMDLQTKLANDGFAQSYEAPATMGNLAKPLGVGAQKLDQFIAVSGTDRYV